MSEEISREEIAELLARESEEMSREQAIAIIRKEYLCVDRDCDIERSCGKCDLMIPSKEPILEAYKVAIKALGQESCEDAISRQGAIDAMYGLCGDETLKENPWRDNPHIDAITDCLERLPSVIPSRPQGHWIFEKGDGKTCVDGYVCSACNKSFHTHVPYFAEYKYCPNCGAKMAESEGKE